MVEVDVRETRDLKKYKKTDKAKQKQQQKAI